MSYAKEILSISSVLIARWQQASESWSWGTLGTQFWGKGGRRGSAMAPFERAMVVSYRLPIATIALSLTIRPRFAIECIRRSNQQGLGHFGAKFGDEGVDRCKPNLKTI